MRECCRGVAQTEQNLIKLIELSVAGPECRFMFILFVDGYLLVPFLEIKSGEPTGTVKGIRKVISVWQRVSILDGAGV